MEIPGGSRNKYELDKASGILRLDRVLYSAVHYPADYGFIPQTLAEDDDPMDVLVLLKEPTFPGCEVDLRPLGVLHMLDRGVPDEKILAVPVDDLHPFYTGIGSFRDLPSILCQQITHFFLHYKDLEVGKWTQLGDWVDVEPSKRLIVDAIERAKTDSGRK